MSAYKHKQYNKLNGEELKKAIKKKTKKYKTSVDIEAGILKIAYLLHETIF